MFVDICSMVKSPLNYHVGDYCLTFIVSKSKFWRCKERCSKESLFFWKDSRKGGDGFFGNVVAVASLTGCKCCKLWCIVLFDLCDLWGICLCKYILICTIIMYVAAYEGYFFVNHSETLTVPGLVLFFVAASGPKKNEAISSPFLGSLNASPTSWALLKSMIFGTSPRDMKWLPW